MGHFKLFKTTKISEINDTTKIPESDYIIQENGSLLQFEFIAEEKLEKSFELKAGFHTVIQTMQGPDIIPIEINEAFLGEETEEQLAIRNSMTKFFNKLDVIKTLFPSEVPKRGVLVYGPPGTGKSTQINKLLVEANDGKTAIILWHTDAVEAGVIRSVFQACDQSKIDRIILVAEDIGGVEIQNARIKSESALLSLLDNQEKIFTKPIYYIGTTNYPENFMENLTNRPGRFDDKVRVGYLKPEVRANLLMSIDKFKIVTESDLVRIKTKECERFTASHLRDIVARAAIYDMTINDAINYIIKSIKEFEQAFAEKQKNRMGFNNYED